MDPELEKAIEAVRNHLETKPEVLSNWDRADLNEMLKDLQLYGLKKTGWPQEDIDHLLGAVDALDIPRELSDAYKFIINNA